MVTARHFDVVVLGRSLGALTAAALLARRDFSVLLLGQGQRAPSYQYERFTLKRRTFSLLFSASPVWARILQDLAQSPTFQRRLRPQEPMFTLAAADRRLSVSAKAELFDREMEREFPEVRQLVDELYGRLANANAAIDAAFARDCVWPAGALREKIEAHRVTSSLPLVGGHTGAEALLAKFPGDHPYRQLSQLPAHFSTDLDLLSMGLPEVAQARLMGSWARGLPRLLRGEDELEQFLLDRFVAHGGVSQLDGSAQELIVRGGRVTGLETDIAEGPVGADAVITDLPGEALAELAGGQGVTKKARNSWPQVTASVGRFVVSLVVRRRGLPESLPQETFLLPPESAHPNPRTPVLHLQRYDAECLGAGADPEESLLVAEALIPANGALTLIEAREAVVDSLRFHLPFLDEHLVLVDSPHDGLPLLDYRGGGAKEMPRVHVKQSSPQPEFMVHQWTVEPPGLLGLAGEPVRGPVAGSFLVGKTTLPAFGQEGELISAWGVARILTQNDSHRQRRRKQLWHRVETG